MVEKIDRIKHHLQASADIKRKLAELTAHTIAEAADCIIDSLKSEGKVLICGNGGSAADSQHIAAEFVGRFWKDRGALPAIALTTDTSILTAVSNDYGFENVFSRQVEALGKKGDVMIGLSTSGNSENVRLALKKAKEIQMNTIAFIGNDIHCSLSEYSDIVISVPCPETPFIQEAHITIGHIMCNLVEDYFFNPKD